jgi:hypothetical protein
MKKLITILSVCTLLLSSCSKDDDNATPVETQVPKTWANMIGPWQFTKLKRPNGSVVDFQPVCVGNKNAVLVFRNDTSNSYKEMLLQFFNANCVIENDFSSYCIFEDNAIFSTNSFPFLEDGKVVSLTQNTMVIEIPTGTRTCNAFIGEATGYSLVRFQQ